MCEELISGLEFMGDRVIKRLKYCGDHVYIYPLTKIIRAENMSIDDYSRIGDYTYIDAGKKVVIGKYTMITWHVIIEGGAETYIGNRVFIGPGAKILTSTYALHGYYSNEFLPESTRAFQYGNIRIEDDAYIGANSVIMPGVTIKEGAVVGANAFVDKDLDAWGIYVGTPARKVGERQKPTEERKVVIEQMDWSNHF